MKQWSLTLMMGVPLAATGAGVQGVVWTTDGDRPDEVITDPSNGLETFEGRWRLMDFDAQSSIATYGRLPE